MVNKPFDQPWFKAPNDNEDTMSQVPDEAICWKGCRAAFTTCSATSQWPEGGPEMMGVRPEDLSSEILK